MREEGRYSECVMHCSDDVTPFFGRTSKAVTSWWSVAPDSTRAPATLFSNSKAAEPGCNCTLSASSGQDRRTP